MSGCRSTDAILARYMAHEDDGEPGMGRRPDDEGERGLMTTRKDNRWAFNLAVRLYGTLCL